MKRLLTVDIAVWSVLIIGSALLTAFTITGHTQFGWIELVGFITGAFCVWLCVKVSVLNFPVGLINSILFVWLFLTSKLYADMAINIVFVALTAWGWYNWLYGGPNKSVIPLRHARRNELIIGIVCIAALTPVLYMLLHQIKDIAPWRDGFTFALSIVAQYFLDRKVYANWLFWITADVIYIQLYFQKDLALIGVLYMIFLAMCIKAVFEWRPALKPHPIDYAELQEYFV